MKITTEGGKHDRLGRAMTTRLVIDGECVFEAVGARIPKRLLVAQHEYHKVKDAAAKNGVFLKPFEIEEILRKQPTPKGAK